MMTNELMMNDRSINGNVGSYRIGARLASS